MLLPAAPGRAETRWERSARRKMEINEAGLVAESRTVGFSYLRRGKRDENWPEIL